MQPRAPRRRPFRAELALLGSIALALAPPLRAAPTAVDDLVFVGSRDRVGDTFQVIVDVLANDHDADGKPLAVAAFSQPLAVVGGQPVGSLHQLEDGTLIFVAPSNPDDELEAAFFTYSLVGDGRTARVDLVGAGDSGDPPPFVDALDDAATTDPGVAVVIPVLDNDVGADLIKVVGTPQHGSVMIAADGASVVYTPAPGFSGNDSFIYTAGTSLDPAVEDTAVVTVTVDGTDPPPPPPSAALPIVLRDSFSGMAVDEPLKDRLAEVPGSLAWGAPLALIHRDGAITTTADARERLHARLDFDPDGALAASDYQIAADVRVVNSTWVAIAFSHGQGRLFADPAELDLWMLLRPNGEFVVHSRGIQALVRGTPAGGGVHATPPFDFFPDGMNRLRLRLEESCPPASALAGETCLSAWVNGSKVVDRIPYVDASGGGPSDTPTTTIERAGFLVNHEADGSAPGDIRVDGFVVRAGELVEPHVDVLHGGVEVESGATLSAGPIAVGESEDLVLSVRNTGDAELSLVNVVPPASGSGWTLVGSVPGTVAVGGAAPITLRLHGFSEGTKTAQLRFDTNDSSQRRFTVGLTAEVTESVDAPVARDDHFVTPMDTSLDVLFSVLLANDSGSELEWSGFPTTPMHGAVSCCAPVGASYAPDAGFVGLDHFTYSVSNPGGSDTATIFVTVDGPPTAAFGVSCSGLTCDFDAGASTDGEDGSPSSFQWSFGDGASGAGELTQHTYAASGTYAVSLTVADSLGQTDEASQSVVLDLPPVAIFSASCELSTCTFDASASSDDDGIVSYHWSFGDGAADAGPPATHRTLAHTYPASGDYTVTLVVADTSGQTAQAVDQVSIDLPPIARFTWSCDSLTCSFDAGSSSDDFGVVGFSWSFGDGSEGAAAERVEHRYREEGVYAVRLTVSDSRQQSDESVEDVTVVDEELFLLLLILAEE